MDLISSYSMQGNSSLFFGAHHHHQKGILDDGHYQLVNYSNYRSTSA